MERIPWPQLKFLLLKSYCHETSFTPEKWTIEQPTYGQCAITVLVAQDYLGGRIQRASVPKEWEERLGYGTHYWNVMEDGKKIDLTKSHFPSIFPYDEFVAGKVGVLSEPVDKRGYLLLNPATLQRYEILKDRVKKLLYSNPMFFDKKHMQTWEVAFSKETVCPKVRFGCVVYEGDRLIAKASNVPMTTQFNTERFCSFDGTKCIRLSLPSRVDSNLGDCGHSPFWALRKVFELGYKPADLYRLDFYEGGFFPHDFSPWDRKEPSYTDLQCQNDFAVLGLDKIFGVFNNEWTPFYTKDSFYSSAKYALGEKII